QPARSRHEVLTEVGVGSDAAGSLAIKCATGCLGLEPLIGSHQEAARAASRVIDREIPARPWVRLYAAHHALDEWPRREVLARSLFALARSFFEQSLECGGFDVSVEGSP